MTPLLEVENLTIRFGGLTAVKALDLAVRPGEILALIGPNGAGKTTVFNAISGVYDPTSGEIRFQGRPLQAPLTVRVIVFAVAVGIITALGMYLLALNPDSLWKAVIRRPNNEALWLKQPFRFDDALTRARQYLRGGLTLEYAPRLVRMPLFDDRTELGDPKVTYNVPGYEIVSSDGSLGVRATISDVTLEDDLAAASRKYELVQREQSNAQAIEAARENRDEILHQMAASSRQQALKVLEVLEASKLEATGAGDRWSLTANGGSIDGLSFRSELDAQQAIANLEQWRSSLPAQRAYRWLMPLLGAILGVTGYLTVWNRSRRTPDVIARGGIARTFQNIRLFHNMTVLENVLVGMDRHFSPNVLGMIFRWPAFLAQEQERCAEALELLQFVGLQGRHDDLAKNLPYGEQRRLEIARALASRPLLLMLDEPAAGMNPAESAELMQLIRSIRDRGITVLLIEHHMKLVMGVSDEIAVLEYGVKIAQGTADEIRNNPQVIEAYLGKEEVH